MRSKRKRSYRERIRKQSGLYFNNALVAYYTSEQELSEVIKPFQKHWDRHFSIRVIGEPYKMSEGDYYIYVPTDSGYLKLTANQNIFAPYKELTLEEMLSAQFQWDPYSRRLQIAT